MGRFCEPEVTRHLLRILLWYFMYIAAVKRMPIKFISITEELYASSLTKISELLLITPTVNAIAR